MNIKIQPRNLAVPKTLDKLIGRKSGKVRKMLPSYQPHDLDLSVSLEKLSKGKQYQTTLVLTTPQAVIRVEDIRENLTASVVRSFDDLERRLKKFKSQLNRERLWQKEPEVVRLSPSPPEQRDIERSISANLEKIENYIRRELYYQALMRHFPPGVLNPQSLVDQVFLEVSASSASKPENVPIEQWMYSVARNTVERSVEQLENLREDSHLEDLSEMQPRWDDEVLNFYQPDEALRLEDILSDQNSRTPEEWLAREETEEQIQKAVAKLPKEVRQSFVLFALEGFNLDEVAMITGKPTSRVVEDVEEARRQIRGMISS